MMQKMIVKKPGQPFTVETVDLNVSCIRDAIGTYFYMNEISRGLIVCAAQAPEKNDKPQNIAGRTYRGTIVICTVRKGLPWGIPEHMIPKIPMMYPEINDED